MLRHCYRGGVGTRGPEVTTTQPEPSRSHTVSGHRPGLCPVTWAKSPSLFSQLWAWEVPPAWPSSQDQVGVRGRGADKGPASCCLRAAFALVLGPGPAAPGPLSLPGLGGSSWP